MRKIKNSFLPLVLVMMVMALVVGCGPKETPVPTVDVNELATNAASTIAAQITETALAMPTSTPEPTYTPVSFTSTPASVTIPTMSSGVTDPAAGVGTIPQVGQTVPTVPVAMPTATLGTTGNQAIYSDQNIKDGTVFKAGQTDDMVWYLTNTGTTTWTTDYSIRFYSGQNFAKAGNTRYKLPQACPPQQTCPAIIDITAPAAAGEYSMAWVLSDEGDNNFYVVDLTIKVE